MSRLPVLDYAQRTLQVLAVGLRQLGLIVYRKLRGRPVQGPQLLRDGLERLSGSFVKFGQILSLQIDTLPRAYCDSLLTLLDRVPPFPREQVDEVFRQQFERLPAELYSEFDYRAVASASIGQVHKAKLKDGTPVAVKVQRPGIRLKFEQDLMVLRASVRLIFFFRITSLYFMRDPVRELSTWTEDELDYRREAAQCQLLADNAVHTPSERVPKIHWNLTGATVLTMDYLQGPSVAEYLRWVENKDEEKLAGLRQQGFVPAVFSSNVITNFLSDSFRFGVFHADLHPANLLILPNNVVGYVDFGIVAILTPEARRKQITLTLAYASGDAEAIYEGFLNICMLSPNADLPGLRRRIEQLAAQWYQEPSVGGRVRFRVTVTRTMMDLLSICQHYGVLVDREMIKYIRSTILADGLVSRLAPDVDLAMVLRKVVESYLTEEARQKVFSKATTLAMLTDLAVWLDSGPAAVLHALQALERGQLRVRANTQHHTGRDSELRTRAVGVATVWGAAALFLGLGGGFPSWHNSPSFAALATAFMAIWSIWLLGLLHRLAKK